MNKLIVNERIYLNMLSTKTRIDASRIRRGVPMVMAKKMKRSVKTVFNCVNSS